MGFLQAEAGDLDGGPCLELLGALLGGPGVAGLRALALGRCLGAALALQPIASDLFLRATSDAGGGSRTLSKLTCSGTRWPKKYTACRATSILGSNLHPDFPARQQQSLRGRRIALCQADLPA